MLVADGSDATRVVFRVTDEFGDLRRYSTAAIALTLDGPAELIGDNPLSLYGGVWGDLDSRQTAAGPRAIKSRSSSFRQA